MRTKPQPEQAIVVVKGRSPREALVNAKRRYGENARIVESRESRERSPDDLSELTIYEVLVALSDDDSAAAAGNVSIPEALAREVARIESLVQTIEKGRNKRTDREAAQIQAYPLGATLLARGVRRPAVLQLSRLWQAEPAGDPREHLATLLRTSGGDWSAFGGRHLVLGRAGAGKTTLVLGAAAALRRADRKPLVLALGPRHKGEIRQLQEEARTHGYDAAVLREADQLARAAEHFDSYDAVLLDTPPVGDPFLADPVMREALASDERLHRHLVVPVDGDPDTRDEQWRAARLWNCDWVAPTRLDLAARPGRLVDLLLAAPSPVSLMTRGPVTGCGPTIPDARHLVALVLASGAPTADEVRGLAAKATEV